MASIVVPARKKLLTQLQCSIFGNVYNEGGKRTGGKYLKARFKGPSLVQYYPPKIISIRQINKMFPELKVRDELEEQRKLDIEARKARGKGAPKKVKSKEESRRTARKR